MSKNLVGNGQNGTQSLRSGGTFRLGESGSRLLATYLHQPELHLTHPHPRVHA